jgi:transcriptional antiterminator RfaH
VETAKDHILEGEFIQTMNWFAIHAKRFRETLAAASISELGLKIFLPVLKVDSPEQSPPKNGFKPLFPGYFFARFDPDISLAPVESARGVLQVIKSGTCPISVDDQVVEEIQGRVEADGFIRLVCSKLKPGDRVSIEDGPFAGMFGRVEAELDDQRRVAIFLECLWQARVLIEKRWVQLEAA